MSEGGMSESMTDLFRRLNDMIDRKMREESDPWAEAGWTEVRPITEDEVLRAQGGPFVRPEAPDGETYTLRQFSCILPISEELLAQANGTYEYPELTRRERFRYWRQRKVWNLRHRLGEWVAGDKFEGGYW